ncbi:MAG: hypothetical protein V1646_01220 [bacterium]
MNFLNKITFLFGLFISNAFLAYPMDTQSHDLKTVLEIISTVHNSKAKKAEFFACIDRLPVDLIREYRTEETGNSLLHLAAIYGKPLFVARLLSSNFFNLFEENNLHFNPIQLAIRNIDSQANSRKPKLDVIGANLEIIEIIATKDKDFYDHFSYVLFLLVKCLVNNDSDDLFEIIDSFYHRYYEHISVDEQFGRANSFGVNNSFDLLINRSNRESLLLTFLRTQNIDARILNNQLEYLLMIASQNPGTSFLNAILEQANLDRHMLCELIHDGERGISKETRAYIISFIKENFSHLLATPGGVIVPGEVPELRPIRRTRSVDPEVLDGISRLDLSKADDL